MRFPLKYIALGASWILIALAWYFLVFLGSADQENSGIVEEWSELFARCRISVETASPLNTQGMQQVTPPKEAFPPGHDWRSRAWQKPKGALIILEQEAIRDDTVLRVCRVALPDADSIYSERAQADILLAYIKNRDRLISEEAHELRVLDRLSPVLRFGFGPVGLNPNGCNVLSFVIMLPEDGFIRSGTGEVEPPTCFGQPSLPVSQN